MMPKIFQLTARRLNDGRTRPLYILQVAAYSLEEAQSMARFPPGIRVVGDVVWECREVKVATPGERTPVPRADLARIKDQRDRAMAMLADWQLEGWSKELYQKTEALLAEVDDE